MRRLPLWSAALTNSTPSVRHYGRKGRFLSATAPDSSSPKSSLVNVNGENSDSKGDESSSAVQPPQSIENRDFYLSILSASSTKREARSYLQRFTPPNHGNPIAVTVPSIVSPSLPANEFSKNEPPFSRTPLANTSNSESRTAAYIQRLLNYQQKYTPTSFATSSATEWFIPEITEDQVHIALVKIRQTQSIDDETLRGIGKTLVKLKKLGLITAVLADSGDLDCHEEAGFLGSSKRLYEQCERVVTAIEQQKGHARIVDGAFSVVFNPDEQVVITLPNLLVTSLSRGIIPVIAPIALDNEQRATVVSADSIVLAFSRLLSMENEPRLVSLDRIIFLDPLGGIPSRDRPNNTAHVFLNLQQEFEVVKEELRAPLNSSVAPSSFSEKGNIHIQNLVTLREALALLPPTSSAIITTPLAAATAAPPFPSNSSTASISKPVPSSPFPPDPGMNANSPAVMTSVKRRITDRNPLIYNLLTDKPVFSSSLPINDSTPSTNTTLLKHGIPLAIYTNPVYPEMGSASDDRKFFTLKGGSIDLDKLVYLIEDSFGKTLNVDSYLSRVNDRIAGLIIAGDYEGTAIITWEDGNTPGTKGGRKKIPYLDKFAVLRRSQGAGGVADVIFKAMVIGLYPCGLVWRSRSNNPVNKWYFERAKGSWKIPGTIWTMFWTGDGDKIDRERFEQYVDICRDTEPSFKAN